MNSAKIIQPEFLKDWWNKGALVSIEETKEGKLKFITAAIKVDADRETVWEVICDFEEYPKFMESVKDVKVKEKSAKSATIEYVVEFQMLRVIKISFRYTTKLSFRKPERIDFKIVEGPFPSHYGYWELIPIGKKQTIICYGVYTDVKKIGLARFFLARNPLIEPAMGVATSTIVIKSIKKRAESI